MHVEALPLTAKRRLGLHGLLWHTPPGGRRQTGSADTAERAADEIIKNTFEGWRGNPIDWTYSYREGVATRFGFVWRLCLSL
jgi:hypothetical protein